MQTGPKTTDTCSVTEAVTESNVGSDTTIYKESVETATQYRPVRQWEHTL